MAACGRINSETPLPSIAAATVLIFLRRRAAALKQSHALEPQWEVLHGEPGEAICRYLKDMPETLLVMTTHGRPLAERLIVGSIAGYCVRNARVPLLLQWPGRETK